MTVGSAVTRFVYDGDDMVAEYVDEDTGGGFGNRGTPY